MRYFLDTEFIEDGHTIDLISVGIAAEDGREFYAVSTAAALHRANDWVRANVMPHLPKYDDPAWMPRETIRQKLSEFLHHGMPTFLVRGQQQQQAELWGYYSDYDWVAVCQLYGTMMQLPAHFPRFCRDLKQLSVDLGSPEHPPDPKDEHNALADARWNRDLYAFLTNIRDEQVKSRIGSGG